MINVRHMFLMAVVSLILLPAIAKATVVDWVESGGSWNFENQTINFAGIQSDGLSFSGNGGWNTRGASINLGIWVLSDGSWTQIRGWNAGGSASHTLESLGYI